MSLALIAYVTFTRLSKFWPDGTYRSKTGLALDNAVWHAHLSAERREPHDQLNGVHIMGNHHELRLALHTRSGITVRYLITAKRSRKFGYSWSRSKYVDSSTETAFCPARTELVIKDYLRQLKES